MFGMSYLSMATLLRNVLELGEERGDQPALPPEVADGTWGMKTEYCETSRKCAGKLCGSIKQANAERLMSDCMLAGLNMVEEIGCAPSHPIEVLRDRLALGRGRSVVSEGRGPTRTVAARAGRSRTACGCSGCRT